MIHDHSYKPNPRFYKGRRSPGESLFFGFELEVETGMSGKSREDMSEVVREMAPFTYCKRDGSIGDGFEIVSHPLSWRWIKQNKARLDELLEHLDKAGVRSYDTTTCGLHVHMSKAGLPREVLESMLRFVFGNPEFILKVSRRNKEDLDHWAKADIRDDSAKFRALDPDDCNKPRRLALNTLPPNTVEFRMFKGTLSRRGFFRALEFCRSLAECIKRKRGDVSVNEFGSFVHSEAEEYPNLSSFLRKHRIGLVARSAVPAAPARRRRSRAVSTENYGLPTASMLSDTQLSTVRTLRESCGYTWASIEEEMNLRRANGMTAFHAFERARRLGMGQSAVASA